MRPVTRRTFLRSSALAAGVVAAHPWRLGAEAADPVRTQLSVDTLAHFVDPLFVPPPAVQAGVKSAPQARTPYYRLPMKAIDWKVHRDVPPTRMWSFGDTFPGPTINATRGQGFWVDWVNALPARHFLPIDHSIHGAEVGVPEVRAVVHVHGARVKPEYDGYPEHWTTPGQTASYYYPNTQEAATLWYHDHTMGINRLNLYAGLMAHYLIHDEADQALGLPSREHDLPLLLCDRILDTHGQLIYPVSGDPQKPWVPEVYGDALLVNGRLFPYVDVEPTAYRLRLVNGCNGRNLQLAMTEQVPLHVVGGDQGLLGRPIPAATVDLLSAERTEVVVDFSAYAGRRVHLLNDARAIVEWRVGTGKAAPYTLPTVLRPVKRLQASEAVATHEHRIGQMSDAIGNPQRMLLDNRRWHDAVTESARLGSIEIWSLVNGTDDDHPIHLHQVRFQILERQSIQDFTYMNPTEVRYAGPPVPPAPREAGWKDTARIAAGMATRLIVQFEGFAGRYMWHCHLAEHGENEMMRPMDILAAP
jgi:spore coat protein A